VSATPTPISDTEIGLNSDRRNSVGPTDAARDEARDAGL
jgi:hypothetical protein